MTKRHRYAGPWACVTCGSRLWASVSGRPRLPRLRCHLCDEPTMVPERRTEPRSIAWERERRATHTATL